MPSYALEDFFGLDFSFEELASFDCSVNWSVADGLISDTLVCSSSLSLVSVFAALSAFVT